MRSEAWRPAAAARNRLPREARDRSTRSGANADERSAAPKPKTATVEQIAQLSATLLDSHAFGKVLWHYNFLL
jgi:hypothetical protein